MKVFLVWTILLFTGFQTLAQYQLTGKVTDAEQKSTLPGAHIRLSGAGGQTITNNEGAYGFVNIARGNYILTVSFVGYQSVEKQVTINGNAELDISLYPAIVLSDEVVVSSTRATDVMPMTQTVVEKEVLEKRNLGQDLPVLLDLQPSVVSTSDAGTGIGYTGIRIRGTDATRINVTINGVPLNDPESQSVYWVNLPDLTSSIDNIQIQRGVGTSTNGAGAFGATLNVKTTGYRAKPFAELSNSFGTFNSRKHTLSAGTGLINNHFAAEARLSKIYSDGYVDRAYADLGSYFTSLGYYGKSTMLKLNIFSGKEQTYQAWWGVPESRLDNDTEGMIEYINNNGLDAEEADNLLSSGRTYNYYTYENEVDNYQQDQYQLLFAQDLSDKVVFNATLFKIHGEGYFEQYRKDDDLSDYGLEDVIIGGDTITRTDLVRQRWLNNDFYGGNISFEITPSQSLQLITGASLSNYSGDHYGEIIWAEYASNSQPGTRFYDNTGVKVDFSAFAKGTWSVNGWNLFGDLQVRTVGYTVTGMDIDQRTLNIDQNLVFFNPKVGASYSLSTSGQVYASFSVGNREPDRNDYIDAPAGDIPKPETLYDVEVGYRRNGELFSFEANGYYMDYRNQLVLTGELNDVGSSIRTNVDHSYRAGLELQVAMKLGSKTQLGANATLSSNKIREFNEILYDYGVNWDEYNIVETTFSNTDISFSPNAIFGGVLSYYPIASLELSWLAKYVGKQYLDNTSNNSRAIDAYFRNDLRLIYSIKPSFMNEINISILANNILNSLYESNGYTYGYFGGGQEFRDNLYYPQSGTNILAGLTLRF